MTTNNTLAERGGWMPIETAPKDGTPVLLFAQGKMVVGGWDSHWSGQRFVSRDIRAPFNAVFTHWMPLPPVPNERGGTGEEE